MFTDTHAHLDFPDFANDLDEIMTRAAGAGIHRIITIGTTIEGSRRALTLADRYAHVFAVIGVHPGNADEAAPGFIDELRTLAAHPKVVALGECGLDYHRLPGGELPDATTINGTYKQKQAEVFRAQLELATELGLNVVVHERDAWDDTLAQLTPYRGRLRAVFHCFGKSPAHAAALLEQNHLVSFTGIVTFKNAGPVRETVATIPASSFMLETDCPFLAPVPFRGKRCEPAHTRTTAEFVAATRQMALEDLAAATETTANSFFRFSPR